MKSRESTFLIFALLGLLSVIYRTFTMDSLGIINNDPISYFNIAHRLPLYDRGLFPVGYPAILRICNYAIGNYLMSSKYIAILAYVLILLFSYLKRFYFKETVMVFVFAGILKIFSASISETVFLPILWLYIYTRSKIIVQEKNNYRVQLIILFSALVSIRYFAIFIIPAEFVFLFILFLKKKSLDWKSYIPQIKVLGAIFIATLIVFTYNFINTQSFMGENVRNHLIRPWDATLKGFILFFNPFMTERDSSNIITFLFSYGLPVLMLIALPYLIYKKRKYISLNYIYCLVMSFVLMMFLYISSFITNLEVIGFRLQSPITIIFYISTFAFIFQHYSIKNYWLWAFALFSLGYFNYQTYIDTYSFNDIENHYLSKIPKVTHCEDVQLQSSPKPEYMVYHQRLVLSYLLFQYRIDHHQYVDPLYRVRKVVSDSSECSVPSYFER